MQIHSLRDRGSLQTEEKGDERTLQSGIAVAKITTVIFADPIGILSQIDKFVLPRDGGKSAFTKEAGQSLLTRAILMIMIGSFNYR